MVATWEAEAGESLEPRSQDGTTAFQPGERARLCLKQKQKQTNQKE